MIVEIFGRGYMCFISTCEKDFVNIQNIIIAPNDIFCINTVDKSAAVIRCENSQMRFHSGYVTNMLDTADPNYNTHYAKYWELVREPYKNEEFRIYKLLEQL